MGKIYCRECGSKINENVDICPKCGKPINNDNGSSDSKKIKNNSTISFEKKETNKKSTYKQSFTSKKNIYTVTGICIALLIIVVMIFGYPILKTTHEKGYSKDDSLLSPPFIDNIGGTDFKIPEGYNTVEGADNIELENLTTFDKKYINSEGNIIWISVSTKFGFLNGQLSQENESYELKENINGHEGIMDSESKFRYIDNGRLITITGANKTQLETIILN